MSNGDSNYPISFSQNTTKITSILHNLSQIPRVLKGTHQIIQKEIDYIYANLERYLLAL